MPSLTGVAHVAVTAAGTCALLRDGGVRCFGTSTVLGTGQRTGRSAQPVTPRGLPPIAALHASSLGFLAVGTDGSVWAWGHQGTGRLLGVAAGEEVLAPARVAGLANVASVAGAAGLTCVVHSDGALSCWGDNGADILGPGSNERCAVHGSSGPEAPVPCRRTPQRIAGVTDAAGVAVFNGAVVALRRDGTLLSWGSNQFGELLEAEAAARHAPAPVPGISGVQELSAFGGTGLCARVGEQVRCFAGARRQLEPVAGVP